jgi:hypothetical protein
MGDGNQILISYNHELGSGKGPIFSISIYNQKDTRKMNTVYIAYNASSI